MGFFYRAGWQGYSRVARNFNSLRNYSTVTVEQLTVLEQVKLENADLDR